MEARRHWFVLFLHALIGLLLALAPPVAVLVFGSLGFDLFEVFGEGSLFLGFFAFVLWLAVLWVYFFIEWTDYYLDVWYITNRRIIDVEQKGLFHREIISLRYDQIQDATVETSGIIATLLRFGDVHVQTAGHAREIILKTATDPHNVKKLILDFHDEAMKKKRIVRLERAEEGEEEEGVVDLPLS